MSRIGMKTGGGSRKGIPNKATAELKAVAQVYTARAIEKLASLAGLINDGEGQAESEQARVSALRELLDRGHGKPCQMVEGEFNVNRSVDEWTTAELLSALASHGITGAQAGSRKSDQLH